MLKVKCRSNSKAVCLTDCVFLTLTKQDYDFVRDVGSSVFLNERKSLVDITGTK